MSLAPALPLCFGFRLIWNQLCPIEHAFPELAPHEMLRSGQRPRGPVRRMVNEHSAFDLRRAECQAHVAVLLLTSHPSESLTYWCLSRRCSDAWHAGAMLVVPLYAIATDVLRRATSTSKRMRRKACAGGGQHAASQHID